MTEAAPTPPASRRESIAILAILLLSTLLSYWAIGTGVPHTVSTDEPDIIQRSLKMMRTADFHPHFFDYGGLTIYLHMFVGSGRFLSGAMSGTWTSLDQVWEGDFYLWSRCVTAFFNVMTVYVIYRVGRRWTAAIGLTAALLTAVHPNLTRQAHFALTDTPLTFFVTLTMLLSLVAAERGALRWFVLAGLTAGLAAATKYNGALALLMPMSAALTCGTVPFRWPAVLAAAGGAAVGFVGAAPYSLLDLDGFLNAFASLASHFTNSEPAWSVAKVYVKYIRIGFGYRNFGVGLWFGWIGWTFILIGAALLLGQILSASRRTQALVALGFASVYFLVLSHQSLKFARYLLPIIPSMCLAAAVAIFAIGPRLRQIQGLRRWPVTAALIALTATPPAIQAVLWDYQERHIKTEEIAAEWILGNLPRGKLILIDDPRIRLPPAFPSEYTTRLLDRSLEAHRERGVAYLVSSSQQTDRFFSDPARYSAEVAGWNRIYASTDMVKIIRPDASHPGSAITVMKVK